MNTKTLVRTALLGLLLYVGKEFLAFIPNVEVVSLFILVYTLVFPKETVFAILVFILLEGIQWGFGLWWWSYIYVWYILYFVVLFLKTRIKEDALGWSIILGIYGMLFGGLFALAYIPVSLNYALSYWMAGIFFDLIHAVSNFLICYFLFKPLLRVLYKFQ